MMYTITTGRICARPPMLRDGAEVVEVLESDNQRRRVPVSALEAGMVLLGLGVVSRITAAEAA